MTVLEKWPEPKPVKLTIADYLCLDEAGAFSRYAKTEVSVAIPPSDLPEPDILIARFEPSARSPVPVETVRLVVEVADTTLGYDLGEKARVYAGGGVPEYWVVDLAGRALHRMWSPAGDIFTEQSGLRLGECIAATTVEGLAIDTDGL